MTYAKLQKHVWHCLGIPKFCPFIFVKSSYCTHWPGAGLHLVLSVVVPHLDLIKQSSHGYVQKTFYVRQKAMLRVGSWQCWTMIRYCSVDGTYQQTTLWWVAQLQWLLSLKSLLLTSCIPLSSRQGSGCGWTSQQMVSISFRDVSRMVEISCTVFTSIHGWLASSSKSPWTSNFQTVSSVTV